MTLSKNIQWKRFLCEREGSYSLDGAGFLFDSGEYRSEFHQVYSYTDLSHLKCLVLLGEPGIGKSTLLREIREIERTSNSAIFYDLGEYSSDSSFVEDFEGNTELNSWLNTDDGNITIIFDSLDETTLQKKPLFRIISQVVSKLDTDRIKILIACRTARWPLFFEEKLKDLFRIKEGFVYELLPLRRVDIETAAAQSGIDPNEFIEYILSVGIQTLAFKPITLRFLLNSYDRNKDQRQINKRYLYRKGCYSLCDESLDRKESGSIDKTPLEEKYLTAQYLAYAMTFSGRNIIWMGGNYEEHDIGDLGISELAVSLPYKGRSISIDEEKIKDTLNTGLFNSRGRQRMSWVHPTYSEFLCVEFMEQFVSQQNQMSFLVFSDGMICEPFPQFLEIVKGLIASNPDLYERVITHTPELLIEEGADELPDEQKKLLIDSLLKKSEAGDLSYHELRFPFGFDGLSHEKFCQQIRSYISDRNLNITTRWLALDLISKKNVEDLIDDLFGVALEKSEELTIRTVSIEVIGKNPVGGSIERLRNLLYSTPPLRVIGAVLKVLWPNYIEIEDLLKFLKPHEENDTYSEYESFICMGVFKGLGVTHLPTVLNWISSLEDFGDEHSYFRRFLEKVFEFTWCMIETSQIAKLFIESVYPLINSKDPHGVIRYLFKSGIDYQNQKCELVLEEISRNENFAVSDSHYIYQFLGHLLNEVDFDWLLEKTLSNNSDWWASLLRRKWNRDDAKQTNELLKARNTSQVISGVFQSDFEALVLDSKEAKKKKDYFYRYEFQEEYDSEKFDISDEIERAIILIEANPSKWWIILNALCLNENGTRIENDCIYGSNRLQDISAWKTLSDGQVLRILDAAKAFIVNGNDCREDWVEKSNTVSKIPQAGYLGFRLILDFDKEYFSKIPCAIWDKWSFGLLEYPPNIMDAASDMADSLILGAFLNADLRSAHRSIKEIIQRRLKVEDTSIRALDRLIRVDDKTLWDELHEIYLESSSVSLKTQISNLLLSKEHVAHTEHLVKAISENQGFEGVKLKQIAEEAIGLLKYRGNEAWDLIWTRIREYDTFATELIRCLISEPRIEEQVLKNISEINLGDLFIWITKKYPAVEKAEKTSKRVVKRSSFSERIERWKDHTLLSSIMSRGTYDSYNTVTRIMEECPSLEWLRHRKITALKNYVSNSCPRFNIAQLQGVIQEKGRPVLSSNDLMEVTKTALHKLQNEMLDQYHCKEDIWDFQQEQRNYRPKKEIKLSEYIARFLRREIEGCKVAVNCEVQIRSSIGSQKGECTDVLVEAFVGDGGGTKNRKIQVIVEVKGCWHDELLEAMETQLCERYLKNNSCSSGLYLVLYFNCDSWDGQDYRKQKSNRNSIEDLKNHLSVQSEELRAKHFNVDWFILDARI